MVLENGLRVVKMGEYDYAALETDDGFDIYRAFNGDWGAVKITTATTADPAAGSQPAAITVPAGKRWLFLGYKTQLVTDATVANRYFSIGIRRNGTNTTYLLTQATAQAASLTRDYYAASSTVAVSSDLTVPLVEHGIECNAGTVIQAYILGIQAGDNLSVAYYEYKEVEDP